MRQQHLYPVAFATQDREGSSKEVHGSMQCTKDVSFTQERKGVCTSDLIWRPAGCPGKVQGEAWRQLAAAVREGGVPDERYAPHDCRSGDHAPDD